MRPFRPLLPATHDARSDNAAGPKPKKQRTSLACQSCRELKSKCDGIRPTCSACTKRGTSCQYTPTQSRKIRERYAEARRRESTYDELFELLRTMSEQDAATIFHQIRSGTDSASILSLVRDGSLLMQLLVAPETYRIYGLPHVARFPRHLCSGSNRYLDSWLFKTISSYSDTSSGPLNGYEKDKESTEGKLQRARAMGMDDYPLPYLVPYRAAKLVEPGLERNEIESWTKVICDKRLLKRLIESYFIYPHPCGPFVHKDLFLQDMGAGKTRFCSALLVNSILALASQSCCDNLHRSRMWLPETLTYKFLAEARRLWDLELGNKSCVTTIQAALILSVLHCLSAFDQVGTEYLEQAVKMSNDLDLFGAGAPGECEEMSKARTFTAWAVFNWQAMFDYYFFRPPHLEQPPRVALPDPELEPNWYGEVWVQYPRSDIPTPLYLRYKMQSEAELHVIMNEIGYLSFGLPTPRALTFHEIVAFRRRLDSWNAALPEPLRPERLVLPLHFPLQSVLSFSYTSEIARLQISIYVSFYNALNQLARCSTINFLDSIQYHHLVMTLMRAVPFDELDIPMPTTSSVGKTPRLIIQETEVLFETVMRLYYMRHSFEICDHWLTFATTILGNMAIEKLRAEPCDSVARDEYLSTLVLAATGLECQKSHYYIPNLVAIQLQGAAKAEDLRILLSYVSPAGVSTADQKHMGHQRQNGWPLPIIGITDDPEDVRVRNVLKVLEDTNI